MPELHSWKSNGWHQAAFFEDPYLISSLPKTPSPFLTVTIMFEHIGEEKVHISFVIFDI
jgi:hypothetical protein